MRGRHAGIPAFPFAPAKEWRGNLLTDSRRPHRGRETIFVGRVGLQDRGTKRQLAKCWRWPMPSSIRSVDWKTYESLPEYLTIRETRFWLEQRGFMRKAVVVRGRTAPFNTQQVLSAVVFPPTGTITASGTASGETKRSPAQNRPNPITGSHRRNSKRPLEARPKPRNNKLSNPELAGINPITPGRLSLDQ